MIAARDPRAASPYRPFVPPPNPRCGTCHRPIHRPATRGWEHVTVAPDRADHYAWLEREPG
jgi:hypothetical protein